MSELVFSEVAQTLISYTHQEVMQPLHNSIQLTLGTFSSIVVSTFLIVLQPSNMQLASKTLSSVHRVIYMYQ